MNKFYPGEHVMLKQLSRSFLYLLLLASQTLAIADDKPQNKVIMFTQTFCPACIHAKQYMQEKNIDFIELDIETNAKALDTFERLNGRGTPLLIVNKKMMYGFDPEFIEINLNK
jgi:glutaredoxin